MLIRTKLSSCFICFCVVAFLLGYNSRASFASDLPLAVQQLQEQFQNQKSTTNANQDQSNIGSDEAAPSEEIISGTEIEASKPRIMEPRTHAMLRALDKITGRTKTFDVAIDEIVKFGSIFMRVRSCQKAPPIETPESAAFVQIWEKKPGYEPNWVFSNWMFASSPALSAMEHPVYDIWVIDCKNLDKSSSSEEKESQGEIIEE